MGRTLAEKDWDDHVVRRADLSGVPTPAGASSTASTTSA